MRSIKNEAITRCELALMGKVVPIYSNDEVQSMTDYILEVLDRDDEFKDLDIIKERICRYSKNNEVKYIVVNTILDTMRCITYLIDTHEEGEPAPFEEDWGTGFPCSFSYCFNVDADDCSEFGDTFYSKEADGYYHRKG